MLELMVMSFCVLPGYGDQKSKASWFPQVETWEGGGNTQMFWTSRNEEWFTKRHLSITEKDGKPLGVNNWRDSVRGFKEGRKAVAQRERWSQEGLNGYITKAK